ncbi:serine--tRNA ligase [Candidatus Woesearchaeota archaeon RBG_13_36_6]|nr:MAG: serine--tRNA ligase [Candidatus Woesearchaeota archaeon RBG_13_36_6]
MLDIKLVRENPDIIKKDLEKRKDKEKLPWVDDVVKKDEEWREQKQKLDELRHSRNTITGEINQLKKQGKDVSKKLKEAKELPEKIKATEDNVEKLQQKVKFYLMRLPNILHDSVPYGKDENDNKVIKVWGKKPKFDFKPKNHLEIALNLGTIDQERAAKVAGAGFVYLKEELALLDLAIQRFAIDFLRKRGYVLIEPPFMINRKAYEGMVDPSDFEMVTYKIEKEDLYLIATAEHPLGARFMGEVFNKEDLPKKFIGMSPGFRKEVGAHGKYTKGLFRMHQFNKIEQFIFCLPEQSWKLFEELQKNSEDLYQKLGLHYQVVDICTGDIGTIAAKKYDIEAWMADDKFREVGSNSNCTDYQARRLNIRFREGEGKPPVGFVHTLNNTALATSRTMIAILEQYQQKDGCVVVPDVLRPYMNGLKKLEKKN